MTETCRLKLETIKVILIASVGITYMNGIHTCLSVVYLFSKRTDSPDCFLIVTFDEM